MRTTYLFIPVLRPWIRSAEVRWGGGGEGGGGGGGGGWGERRYEHGI